MPKPLRLIFPRDLIITSQRFTFKCTGLVYCQSWQIPASQKSCVPQNQRGQQKSHWIMNFFFHNWKSWQHCERPLLEWCNAFTPFLLPISQKNGSTLFFRLYHTHAPYFFEILVYCYSWPVCSDTVWINLWRREGCLPLALFFALDSPKIYQGTFISPTKCDCMNRKVALSTQISVPNFEWNLEILHCCKYKHLSSKFHFWSILSYSVDTFQAKNACKKV